MYPPPIQDLTQEPSPLAGLPIPLDELEFGAALGLRDKRSIRGHIAARRLPDSDLILAGRPRWSRALVVSVLDGTWKPAPEAADHLHASIRARVDRLRAAAHERPSSIAAALAAEGVPGVPPGQALQVAADTIAALAPAADVIGGAQ